MYSFGLNFAFGNEQKDPMRVVDRQREEELRRKETDNKMRSREIKMQYKERIADLEKELNEAYIQGDRQEIERINRQLDNYEMIIRDMERREMGIAYQDELYPGSYDAERRYSMDRSGQPAEWDNQNRYSADRDYYRNSRQQRNWQQEGAIRMSPEQFEELLSELMRSTDPGYVSTNRNYRDGMGQDRDRYRSGYSNMEREHEMFRQRLREMDRELRDLRMRVDRLDPNSSRQQGDPNYYQQEQQMQQGDRGMEPQRGEWRNRRESEPSRNASPDRTPMMRPKEPYDEHEESQDKRDDMRSNPYRD